MALHFTVLASGSSGNASLVRAGNTGLLLDLGLGPRELAKRFAAVGVSWNQVHAAILSHIHSDHWNERTLAYLRRLRIPLYCHPEHHHWLEEASEAFVGLQADDLVRAYPTDTDFEILPNLRCRALPVLHDGGATFGFRLEATVGLFGTPAVIGYATDLGSWTAELAEALAQVDVLALEFNHDVQMEYASGRSPLLIRRVLGDEGHLSNEQAAALLGEILRRSTRGRLRHVVQLHLSRHCNDPELAQAAAETVLADHPHIGLHTASQDRPGPRLRLDPDLIGDLPPRRARPSVLALRRPFITDHPCLPGFEAG